MQEFMEMSHKERYFKIIRYIRFFGSGCLTLFATFIVVYGIFAGESSFAISFSFLPSWFGFILLLVMLGILLLLEGALVCIVDLSKHPNVTFKDQYPRAAQLHAENSDEESVMSFIIGRQVLVIFTVFIAAQLTGMPNMVNFPFTNSPFPSAIQSVFLAPGVLGGVVTVVFAQLMIATNYPVQFLNIPGIWIVVRVCKFFDWIGLVHVTWVVADIICRFLRLNDEVTVVLKEYDHNLHVVKIPDSPQKEFNDNARFNLSPDSPDYIPEHIMVCKLIEALKDKPIFRDALSKIIN